MEKWQALDGLTSVCFSQWLLEKTAGVCVCTRDLAHASRAGSLGPWGYTCLSVHAGGAGYAHTHRNVSGSRVLRKGASNVSPTYFTCFARAFGFVAVPF